MFPENRQRKIPPPLFICSPADYDGPMAVQIKRDLQYYKFCLYGFIKNLQFFDPYLILFFREMGISFLQIGVLFSLREIVTNLMEIPSGMIADTVGRRRSMVFSFVSYIASFLVFFFVPHFTAYLGAMVLFGFGEAFRTGTHKAMILEYLKIKGIADQKIHYYGRTRSWSQAGASLSALIAALLVFYSGSYRYVFLFTVIPYTLDLLLMLSYPAELDGTTGDKSTSWKETGARFLAVWKDFLAMFRDSFVRRALLSSSLYDGLFKTIKDYIQPLLRRLALALPILLFLEGEQRTSVVVGLVYTGLYLFTTLLSRLSGTLSDAFPGGHRPFINATYLLGAAVMGGMGILVHQGYTAAGVALFILYFGMMNLRRPVSLGFLSERISSSIMATGLSGESQAKTLFVAVLAPLMGWSADRWGVGAALAGMALLSLLLYPLVRIRPPQKKS